MKNIVKNNVIEEANSLQKLFLIELKDSKNLRLRKNTDIEIVTARYLNISGASESQKTDFLAECFQFVMSTTEKIFERMSKNFVVLKAASSLNSILLGNNAVLCEICMVHLLQFLYFKGQISSGCSEGAEIQFEVFLEKLKKDHNEQLDYFTEDVGLDDLYFALLKPKEFADLWDVVKLVLILSHGNAVVESGFSINKDMLVENLKEDSLISLRTV